MLNRYFWNILMVIDQAVNTLLGGDPRETMSSRMGRLLRIWKKTSSNSFRFKIANFICTLLSVIDTNHCDKEVDFTDTPIGSLDIWKFKKG